MFRVISIIICLILASCGGDKSGTPPKAAKVPYEVKLPNGEVMQDYYHWMRDKNWPREVSDQKILDHLAAENTYIDAYFSDQKENTQKLFEEMKGRIKLADSSAPIKRDDYYYYSRTEEDKSYRIFCRKLGSLDAEEEVLLDVNELAKDKKYVVVRSITVSEDHNLLAYSVDYEGNEKYKIQLLDLRTREYLPDTIDNTIGSLVWHSNNSSFFYTPRDEDMKVSMVKHHKLGEEVSSDITIYKEKDSKFFVSIGSTSSEDYMVINTSTASESENHLVSLRSDDTSPILVKLRKDGVMYNVENNGDDILIHTNEYSPNMSVSRTKLSDLRNNIWRSFIPEDDEKYLESIGVTEDYIMLNYKHMGLPVIKVLNLKLSIAKLVDFPDEIYTAYAYSTNYKENDLRVNYSSMNRAAIVYSYDFGQSSLSVMKAKEVLGGYNPDEYVVKRLWAPNGDVNIPISVIYKKDLFKNDGSNPMLLYAYGSYGISVDPVFYTQYVSLLDRGFVFAIAHVRGGDTLGYSWYEAGKLLSKKNSFEDFVVSAKYLIEENYTSSEKLAISGGSAGGMLVGASINMEPELFRAAIASSPSVDVLTNMLDKGLMGTEYHYTELGDPNEEEYLDYIKSYSPYSNIKKANYPYIYAQVGISDPRVPYYSGAKWASKLRAHSTSGNPVFLRANMNFGHFGASDRFEYLKEYAEQFMFIFDALGVKF